MDIEKNFEIKNLSTFKIGGKINEAFFPENENDFEEALRITKNPLIIGSCSNLLISDLGIEEAIITSKMKNYQFYDNGFIKADCGLKGSFLALEAQKRALSGFEFLIAFPASIGGAVYMNASSSQWISDIFKTAVVFDLKEKKIKELSKEQMNFSYRKSVLQEKTMILLSAKFQLLKGNKDEIQKIMEENILKRKNSQPNLNLPNIGSIFKNPENMSAGKLLDDVNAKNMRINEAFVFENHANFIINKNKKAKSKDVLKLMVQMQDAVYEKFGVQLKPEIEFVGIKDEEDKKLWEKLTKTQK